MDTHAGSPWDRTIEVKSVKQLHELAIRQYDSCAETLLLITKDLENHIKKLLNSSKIHAIQSRTKDRESVWGKIHKHTRLYFPIYEVTDLFGIRIITYFERDVAEVSKIIEGAFSVDFGKSIDKGKAQAPDTFGYRSIHYICGLPDEIQGKAEYEALLNKPGYEEEMRSRLKFEVQIRSILQHAWAEIEHDLGYKSTSRVPSGIKRKFARIAGALEGLDEDFNKIAEYSIHHKNGASVSSQEAVDGCSIQSMMRNNPRIKAMAIRISERLQVPLAEEGDTFRDPGDLAHCLNNVDLRNLSQLTQSLIENENRIVDFTQIYEEYIKHLAPIFDLGQRCYLPIIDAVTWDFPILFLPVIIILSKEALDIDKLSNLENLFFKVFDDRSKGSHDAAGLSLAMLDSYRKFNDISSVAGLSSASSCRTGDNPLL